MCRGKWTLLNAQATGEIFGNWVERRGEGEIARVATVKMEVLGLAACLVSLLP